MLGADGQLPSAFGIAGNAAFTMVALQVLAASGGRWSLVAVWHAMLNAAGGSFFFTMVSGDDKDCLGLLLAGTYTLVAVVAYVACRRLRIEAADGRRGPVAASV